MANAATRPGMVLDALQHGDHLLSAVGDLVRASRAMLDAFERGSSALRRMGTLRRGAWLVNRTCPDSSSARETDPMAWEMKDYRVLASCKEKIVTGWPRHPFERRPNVPMLYFACVETPRGERWCSVGSRKQSRVGSTVRLATNPANGMVSGFASFEDLRERAVVTNLRASKARMQGPAFLRRSDGGCRRHVQQA